MAGVEGIEPTSPKWLDFEYRESVYEPKFTSVFYPTSPFIFVFELISIYNFLTNNISKSPQTQIL